MGMAFRYFNAKRPLLLATDLDGTFLGGSPEDRHRLYSLINSHRSSVQLLFCTGRSQANVQPLYEAFALPKPDLMICDVGTTIIGPQGDTFFDDLQQDIVQRWGDGHDVIARLLFDLPLTRQAGTGPWRRSYLYDNETVALEAKARVEAAGFDGLLSDNLYFDVLPRKVNKGSTLRQVVSIMGFAPDDVLVAGDTLNDLSMLICGFPAVVVANAEQRLMQALPRHPKIFIASRPGAAGILEAIAHHPAMNQGAH